MNSESLIGQLGTSLALDLTFSLLNASSSQIRAKLEDSENAQKLVTAFSYALKGALQQIQVANTEPLDQDESFLAEFFTRPIVIQEFSQLLDLRWNTNLDLSQLRNEFELVRLDKGYPPESNFFDNLIRGFVRGFLDAVVRLDLHSNLQFGLLFATAQRLGTSTIVNIILVNHPNVPFVLTPDILETQVSPYLSAIAKLQNLVSTVRKHRPYPVTIKAIRQSSPVSVSLSAAADAIQIVRDSLVPWRKRHAEKMAQLLEQEKQADIESKKAEILEKRAHAERERVEAKKQREEAERLKLENEKLRLELQRFRVLLAVEILAQAAPNLSEAEKIAYLLKILPPLDVLIFSELEVFEK